MRLRGIPASLTLASWLTTAAAGGASVPPTDAALYVLQEAVAASASTAGSGAVFREIRRDSGSSLIQFDVNAGAKESSMLFMLEGFCGLMRERQHRSAVAEQISMAPVQFRVTFPESPRIEDKPGPPRLVFTDVECNTIRRR